LPDEIAEFPMDNGLAEILMGDRKIRQKIVVEEMAKGAMPHVVKEAHHPQIPFHQRERRAVAGQNLTERRIEMPGKLSGKVHRPDHVLEPGVLSPRIRQMCSRKLSYSAHPLEDRIIDDSFFRFSSIHVAVDGVSYLRGPSFQEHNAVVCVSFS
jgi:hypothetical protein